MTHALRPFERDVITRLCASVLGARTLDRLLGEAEVVDLDHTGMGYFLTLRHPDLPADRHVASTPFLLGESGDVCVGFVVFLQDRELTLDCHNLGTQDWVPLTVRELALEIRISADA
ncbi:MAG: hypothetical protein AAGA56_07355 [Myxococcota bacterium]